VLTVRGSAFTVKWEGTSGTAVATAPPQPGYFG
jgi:hypothetical protein